MRSAPDRGRRRRVVGLLFLADWTPNHLNTQRSLGVRDAGLSKVPAFVGADLGNVGGGGPVPLLAAHGRPPAGRRCRRAGRSPGGRPSGPTPCVATLAG